MEGVGIAAPGQRALADAEARASHIADGDIEVQLEFPRLGDDEPLAGVHAPMADHQDVAPRKTIGVTMPPLPPVSSVIAVASIDLLSAHEGVFGLVAWLLIDVMAGVGRLTGCLEAPIGAAGPRATPA